MAALAVLAFFGIAGSPHQALVKVSFRYVFQPSIGPPLVGDLETNRRALTLAGIATRRAQLQG